MTPAYEDANAIPYLLPAHCAKLKMTNTRKKQLLKAANRNWDEPPQKPGNDECCGSNCTPCVKDLWKEDVMVWKQRWGFTDEKEAAKQQQRERQQGMEAEESGCSKVPGCYSW